MQKKLASLCRLILSDKNTRNLFFFLIINLLFAFVELFYGLLTNSLGLISDSFHMFFDCSALLLGLAASIVSKWKPNDKFTYGFGRAEVLAGLANGLFLLFIALFIMKEAIERSLEPPEVHHERLFFISVLGFMVNLIGIFVFQHGGQGHHHHGGSCSHFDQKSHKHTKHDHHHHSHSTHDSRSNSHFTSPTIVSGNDSAVALDMNGYSSQRNSIVSSYPNVHNSDPAHQHLHHHNDSCNHQHHDPYLQTRDHAAEPLIPDTEFLSQRSKTGGRGQIMQSVFLHIVADTLGSIGVMISALLMSQFGWMIADPICSLFIAILISISVYPLLRDSFYVLMQRVPVDLEDKLPSCLHSISTLPGVMSVHETHFWTLNSDTFVGCLKLEVSNDSNQRYILDNSKALLNHLGVERVHIQIDRV